MLTNEQRRELINDIKENTDILTTKHDQIHILFDWDRDMFGFEGVIESQEDLEEDIHQFCERCNTTILNPLYVFVIKKLIKAGLLDKDYKTQCCTCRMFENLLENAQVDIFLDYIVQTCGKLGYKRWREYVDRLAKCDEFYILKDLEFLLKLNKRLKEYVSR
jgi:hypothetical protein